LLFSTTEDPLDSTPPSFYLLPIPQSPFLFKEKQALNSKQQQRRKGKNGRNTDGILRPSFKTPPRQTQPNKKASAKSRHETASTNRTAEGRKERERMREKEVATNEHRARAGGGEATGYLRTETG
jgi:hypothetical protein